jgi:RimJ/RimL family protein N-acetyltransferase
MKYLLEGQETERLTFRLLKESDFDKWMVFFRDSGAAGFLGILDLETPEEQCRKWFEIAFGRYRDDLGGMNALIEKNSGEFIGQSGLLVQEVDGQPEMEVSYSIMPRFWNKGYATEAAMKCRNYAFEKNFAQSLISIIHVDNIQSQSVALKNGMSKSKQTIFKRMPVNIYRIDKQYWAKQTAAH